MISITQTKHGYEVDVKVVTGKNKYDKLCISVDLDTGVSIPAVTCYRLHNTFMNQILKGIRIAFDLLEQNIIVKHSKQI